MKKQKASTSEIVSSAATLRQRVYECLKLCENGATDEEMQVSLEMDGSTQRPRRVRLVELGMVRDSGRTSTTNSGRNAVVWEVTDLHGSRCVSCAEPCGEAYVCPRCEAHGVAR